MEGVVENDRLDVGVVEVDMVLFFEGSEGSAEALPVGETPSAPPSVCLRWVFWSVSEDGGGGFVSDAVVVVAG
jgi:hypothetical protein